MKKISLVIIILIGISILGSLDYYLNIHNKPNKNNQVSITEGNTVKTTPKANNANTTKSSLKDNKSFDYEIVNTNRTSQIFEKFDLSTLKGVEIYKNNIKDTNEKSVTIYEIQAKKEQGGLSYIALKSIILDQIDATGTINEVGNYGQNSFYYNNINRKDTVFLLTQIEDNLYGFQSNKQSFKTVESMIQKLMLHKN